jgi:hypothetical protein
MSSLLLVLPSYSVSFAMWSFGRLTIRSVNHCWLWFSSITAGVMLASAMSALREVVPYIQ